MITLDKWLLVMLGGSLGAASRYGVSLLSARLFGTQFPYGTLLVTWPGVSASASCSPWRTAPGCSPGRAPAAHHRLPLGALTTFSTFSWKR